MGRNKDKRDELAKLLVIHMKTQGIEVGSMARTLGISASYMSQLLAGDKTFKSANFDLLRSVASVLGLPGVIAFILVGQLKHEDFVEPYINIQTELEHAMRELSTSPYALELGEGIDELSRLPVRAQHLLATLYGVVTNRQLVSQKKRWPWTTETPAPKDSQLLRPSD